MIPAVTWSWPLVITGDFYGIADFYVIIHSANGVISTMRGHGVEGCFGTVTRP